MKINLTKKEYRTLLDVLQIADWVLHAHKFDEEAETEDFALLEQKFLALAKDMGFAHLVEYDPEMKKYFPSKVYEEQSSYLEAIDEYNNDSFWDELINRLASRDLVLQEGKDRVQEMDLNECLAKAGAIREKYEAEFEQHGLERLFIKE